MDTEYSLTTATTVAKAILKETLLLAQALHHESPLLYDAIKYTLAAYLCYRTLIFTARSMYSTVIWMIRTIVIIYVVYIVMCVLSTIDATSTSTNGASTEVFIDAVVSTTVRETKRLYSVARLVTASVSLVCRRLLQDGPSVIPIPVSIPVVLEQLEWLFREN